MTNHYAQSPIFTHPRRIDLSDAKKPLRACWVSRWIKADLHETFPGTYQWPYISQMGLRVLVESRNYKLLGFIAENMVQRKLHIVWGGQWLGTEPRDWENWLEISRG